MTPRAVLVTGPTRGLGRELVGRLVERDLCDLLVLVGRPGAALAETARYVRERRDLDVVAVGADLSSVAEVHAAADEVVHELSVRHRPLDALALNAARQMSDARTATVDGLEATFAVGLLANHVLLDRLHHHLAPDAHVVVVGSGTHHGEFPATLLVPAPRWRSPAELSRPWPDPDAGTSRAGRRAYATMKLGVNYLAAGWRDRLAGTARVNVYDPGLMPGTGLVRTGGWRQTVWDRVMPALTVLPGVATPAVSAGHFADLLVGATFPTLDGGYVELGRARRPSAESSIAGRAEELLAACDDLAAVRST